jgi:ankyrin repeat protein
LKVLLFSLSLLAMAANAQSPLDRELIAAAERGDLPGVQKLIARGANVNAKDEKQDSAFLIASARGRTAVVRATLAAGADLKSTNRYGGTGLIPACHYGHLETVKLLLTTRIDVDHVNNLGWTALLEAVILGDGGPTHTEIVRLLLAHGANPRIADRDGVTALQHARARNLTKIAEMLAKAG